MTPTPPPNLVLTAEERDFDPVTTQHFRDEGFLVTYVAFNVSREREYEKRLVGIADTLEAGEKYAIVGQCYSPAYIL